MAVSLKHSKTSGKADGADSTLVQPSDWNAEHALVLGSGKLLGRTAAGDGAAEEISVGTGLALSGGSLSLSQVATATFKGRTTAGTGNVEDLSATQATALLDSFAGSLKGLVPASVGGTANFLRADGSWAAPTASLSNWTEAVNTSAPNATVPVVSFTATNGATNVDMALLPKGTGAITAQIADGTTTGGNKRGTYSVDLQRFRNSASNVASGTRAFIGAGFSNTSSGSASAVVCGDTNTASGSNAAVLGGQNNTASNSHSMVGGGFSNTSSQSFSVVSGGSSNTANARSSAVTGGRSATTRSVLGAWAHSPSDEPISSTVGNAQIERLIVARETTNATATVLASDSSAAGSTNQVVLPNNSAYYFKGKVIAAKTAAGDTSAWTFEGAIKRGANAASTALVAAVTPTLIARDAGASGWVLAVAADTTNGGLKVTVTGQAATTIRWVCHIETTEVTF